MKYSLIAGMLLLVWQGMAQTGDIRSKGVSFVETGDKDRVDVYVDGKLFTSYIYPSTLEKPVLYPVTTAEGTLVTRGFPLQPRPGERVDHPHQVGWWLNYGDVNGLDFWNNSYAIPADQKPKYGSIRHTRVIKAAGDSRDGALVVQCAWVDHQKNVILDEQTTFEFSGDKLNRRIIRTTTLKAANGDVRFGDNKEGMCALRVDRAFESPSLEPELFTDASGNPTSVPVLNNEGVNGLYRNSNGLEGDAVWGVKAAWVSLSARKGNEDISLCLFDHPGNPGYQAYWHARGYGLFSVNNIGCQAYNPDDAANEIVLKRGQSLTFKHMLLIRTGGFVTKEEMDGEAAWFAGK
jgi:hypothetical protein